jgi:hypothetical protein
MGWSVVQCTYMSVFAGLQGDCLLVLGMGRLSIFHDIFNLGRLSKFHVLNLNTPSLWTGNVMKSEHT